MLIGVRIDPLCEVERLAQEVTLPDVWAKGTEAVIGPLEVDSEKTTIEEPAVTTPVVELPNQVKDPEVKRVVVVVAGAAEDWIEPAAFTWAVG